MPGKCVFNEKWLLDSRYKEWIEMSAQSKHVAYYKVCRKEINIARIGKSAIKVHMASKIFFLFILFMLVLNNGGFSHARAFCVRAQLLRLRI